jgi:hypothetical protein
MARPKKIKGELVTCSFELTREQSAYLTMRAMAAKVSRSHIIRALLDMVMQGGL